MCGASRRERQATPVVALVGYTNAGKSTLFNGLTKAGSYAADQLFATLDTTSRQLYLADFGQVVLSDTVGFIRDLPHTLVAAFHATLEETAGADLLLHVIDASAPDRDAQIEAVDRVLVEVGADAVSQIRVYNKIDRTPALAPGVDPGGCDTIEKCVLVRDLAQVWQILDSPFPLPCAKTGLRQRSVFFRMTIRAD